LRLGAKEAVMDLRLILSVGMMIGGLIFGIVGMYLLATQKFIRGDGDATEVEIPIFGRIKTNYPSLVAVVLGAFLLYIPLQKLPGEAPKLHIEGQVTQDGQPPKKEILVVLAPAKYKNFTGSTGKVSIDVDNAPGEGDYTGIAYYADGSCKDVKFAEVNSTSSGKGEFNADVSGSCSQH
jgi:hypothetical protein